MVSQKSLVFQRFQTMAGILRAKDGDGRSRNGGRRAGAGRKKAEPRQKAEPRPSFDAAALALLPPPDDIGPEARKHARLAMASLVEIALSGRNELARVRAAKVLLDRAGAATPDDEPEPAERSKWDALIH